YETDEAAVGLNEGIVRWISAKREEPQWLLDWRLKACKTGEAMTEATWSNVHYPKIDFQSVIYYSAPKQDNKPKSLDEVDPELLEIYERLGISLKEQKRLQGVAVDVVLDSVSVGTTFKESLSKLGIIFCSFSDAVTEH